MLTKTYKFITIKEINRTPSGKTSIFEVSNNLTTVALAIIRWNTSYRSYAFYPMEETYYDEKCLNDISEFLKELKEKKQWKKE